MSRKLRKLNKKFIKIYREDSLRENKGVCAFCHEPLTYKTVTAEHKIPKSKGGTDRKENIGATCRSCNSLKGNMSDNQYLNLIKRFPSGKSINYLLAWSRRRLNLQVERSIRNIERAIGKQL